MHEKLIGKVTHYFPDLKIATVELTEAIKLGDELIFRHGDEEVLQTIESIQVEDEAVHIADAGDIVGIAVHSEVVVGTKVYKNE